MSKFASVMSKRAAKHTGAGVFILIPSDLAKQFPSLGKFDSSDTHITALYIGKDVPKSKEAELVEVIKDVLAEQEPFEVTFDDHVTYFQPTKHSEGCKVAKMGVKSKGLHTLHTKLKDAVKEAGIPLDDHFPDYKPHVTLSYMKPPKDKWDGDVPAGSFTVDGAEIWGCGNHKHVEFGAVKKATISKRASTYGWWLNPEGKLYPVPFQDHKAFVLAHPEFFADPLHPELYAYDRAFKRGWIRIANERDTLFFEMPSFDIKYLKRIQNVLPALPIVPNIMLDVPKADYFSAKYWDLIDAKSFDELRRIAKKEATKRISIRSEEEVQRAYRNLPQDITTPYQVQMAKDPLAEYKAKRTTDTPEPEGKVEKGENQHRFVIQKHKADVAGLHFDLRLENDQNAMSSWAIPKARLPKGKERLLAQKTEDHPISYNTFSGEIEEGYGKGTVKIHDSGHYEEIERTATTIKFRLKGSKEHGTYVLVNTDGKKWLLLVGKDEQTDDLIDLANILDQQGFTKAADEIDYLLLKLAMSFGRACRVLGVSEFASREDIQKAFKTKALKAHPDVGGDAEEMKLLNIARDLLLRRLDEVVVWKPHKHAAIYQ